MIKRLLCCLLLLSACTAAFAHRSVEFFMAAHQDDWQLFMGQHAYNAMNDPNLKVVFIHTTAGDASYGNPVVDRRYWMSRERGAINSIEFCLDILSLHSRDYMDTVTIKGHRIARFRYKNVVNYFLRLPDGCGSVGWHGQSLEYLRQHSGTQIMAVDSSAVYNGWDDLVGTVRTIFENEADTCTNVGLNIPESDPGINPGDHRDHVHTGLLGQEAAQDMDYTWQRRFMGYHVDRLPVNLEPDEVALKAAIYAVAEFGRSQGAVSSSWCKGHIDYLCRSYYRTIPSRLDSVLHSRSNVTATIFPNPVKDVLHVAYQVDQTGQVMIEVRNMDGTAVLPPVIAAKKPGDYDTRVNCAPLPAGLYLISLTLPGGSLRTFTVQKQ